MDEKLLSASSERIFRIPAMILINENGLMTTTEIIDSLRILFGPLGVDTNMGKNRNDDLFSQKVRNIKSHDSLNEFVYYSKQNGWSLKPEGIKFLADNNEIVTEIDAIMSNTSFTYYEKITFIDLAILPFFPKRAIKVKAISTEIKPVKKVKKIIYFDENISEGKSITKTIKLYERSKKLRESAIAHFSDKDGNIKCSICGFDFGKEYGKFGKGYIEIHHKKPIFSYEDEKEEQTIDDAMKNLIPVCSNCHRMLHHKKDVSVEELIGIYKNNKQK